MLANEGAAGALEEAYMYESMSNEDRCMQWDKDKTRRESQSAYCACSASIDSIDSLDPDPSLYAHSLRHLKLYHLLVKK